MSGTTTIRLAITCTFIGVKRKYQLTDFGFSSEEDTDSDASYTASTRARDKPMEEIELKGQCKLW